MIASETWLGITRKGMPIFLSNCRRRGDDAKMNCRGRLLPTRSIHHCHVRGASGAYNVDPFYVIRISLQNRQRDNFRNIIRVQLADSLFKSGIPGRKRFDDQENFFTCFYFPLPTILRHHSWKDADAGRQFFFDERSEQCAQPVWNSTRSRRPRRRGSSGWKRKRGVAVLRRVAHVIFGTFVQESELVARKLPLHTSGKSKNQGARWDFHSF